MNFQRKKNIFKLYPRSLVFDASYIIILRFYVRKRNLTLKFKSFFVKKSNRVNLNTMNQNLKNYFNLIETKK